MAMKPKHPCNKVGCRNLTTERYCEEHKVETHKAYDRYRGSAAERGYNSRWRRYRAQYIREHPLCCECEQAGIVTPTFAVDHIIPHRGDPELFWDPANHQPLCKRHHDQKTVREDGGFGNARRTER